MSTTEIERRASVSLFNGATPDLIIGGATEVATLFSDIVKRQRMFTRIGGRDHILIEAWQTIGTLTGVFATEAGGVRELPWPEIESVDASDEHYAAILQSRGLGRAWGYAAAFRAVKDGREVGWGEGRVTRSERTWAGRDDYALASMAQTRGQSRALGAPLRFIVKLAGYEATLPDDMPQEPGRDATETAAPWGPTVDDDEQLQAAAQIVAQIAPEIDAAKFILEMGSYFDGVPDANLKMLRALNRRIGEARTPRDEEPGEETQP
jgi:hypothetical protein